MIFRKMGISIVAGLIVGTLIWHFVLPQLVTEARLENAVRMAKAVGLGKGSFCNEVDWWGNRIKLTRLSNDEHTVITYSAISAGQDGEYETKDDITAFVRDVNNAKILGKLTGETAVQFLKGVKKGVTEKSKHDK